MAWKKMLLRGKEVFARCDAEGALIREDGRVDIQYKPGGKLYRAGVSNLQPSDDARVVELAEPSKEDTRAKPGAKRPAKGAKGSKSVANPPLKPKGDEVIAYCDGACSGNPGPAGLGVVLLDGDQRRELSEFLGRGTNNIAELTAIARVFEAVEPARRLEIYTDSKYSIDMLLKGWRAKKNTELIEKLRAQLGERADCKLFHVTGHAGVVLNERADQLAVAAVEAKMTAGWSRWRRIAD